jgi:hypothetical protein
VLAGPDVAVGEEVAPDPEEPPGDEELEQAAAGATTIRSAATDPRTCRRRIRQSTIAA